VLLLIALAATRGISLDWDIFAGEFAGVFERLRSVLLILRLVIVGSSLTKFEFILDWACVTSETYETGVFDRFRTVFLMALAATSGIPLPALDLNKRLSRSYIVLLSYMI
jgi:hypothetical protein